MTILGLTRAIKLTPILGNASSGVASVLLYGPKGCGKSLLVARLSEAWLAKDGASEDRAIDSFRRGANPDFFHIQPTGAGHQIQLRQISTPATKRPDDPTPLLEYVRTPPLYSRHKVVWIEDVHRLNHDSANSLLKTLEEPPAYVKIILTTSQVSQIPATILSRCLVLNCELPTPEELRSRYPAIAPEVLALAEGTPGTLERISATPDLYADILRFARLLSSARAHEALVLSEQFRKLSDNLDDEEKLGPRNANARTLELIAIASSKHDPNPILIQSIAEAHRRILANANPGLTLDAMLGRITLANETGTNR